MIAFLYLIYDKINDKLFEFTKNGNIYIHPKYPNKIDNKLKPYVIKKLIQTEWGNFSIVNATINLLEEAYKNNKWFILLSGDSYPLYDYNTFINIFNNIHNNKSCFNYANHHHSIYKTSQFFILNKDDVSIILNKHNQYKNIFMKYIKNKMLDGAPDEYYFLSLLKYYNNNYKFINYSLIYVRWIGELYSLNPFIFNYITKYDKKVIKESKSLFMRKVSDNFSNKVSNKTYLYIIIVGIETDQNKLNQFIELNKNDSDFMIISFLKYDKIIIKNYIYMYRIYYSKFDKFIDKIITDYKNLLIQWQGIIIIPEIFNYDDLKINYNKIIRFENDFIFYDIYNNGLAIYKYDII